MSDDYKNETEFEKHNYDDDERGPPPTDMQVGIAAPIDLKALLIVVTELSERFAYYGSSLMYQTYMLNVLNQTKSGATAINRGFQFFSYFTTIFGALVADQYLGKFKTILVFSLWYTVGLVLLTASSTQASLDAGFGLGGFILSTYLFIALGTGGIKANVSSFVAEQVAPGYKPAKSPGVYYDSNLTVERIFRYFYWAINIGSFVGQLICPPLAQNVSYPIAYMVPALMFVFGIIVFTAGAGIYVKKPPSGSVLIKVLACFRYARSHKQPGQEHWLDGALNHPEGAWTNEFVHGLKRTISASKVFLFYPIYWALYGNMSDNFINQATTMTAPDWLPVEQLNLINPIVLIISIPLFDTVVFPLLRRAGCRLGPITRITIGFTIVCVGFVYATILQKMIYKSAPYYDFTGKDPNGEPIHVPELGAHNDISVWWQIVPYAGIALSEIFSSVTGLEFAFKQAPAELKSVVTALYLFTNCGGSLIGLLLAIWSKDPTVLYVFAGETVAMAIFTVIFYFLFRSYDDKY